MFVIALAVSDILMCICCMPFTVVTLFHGQWIFGESFCLFQGFAALTFGIVAMDTMGIIAVNRFFCVVKPERSNRVFCLGVNLSQLRANVEEAKVTKTLAVLLGFACCWLPISVVDNVDAARGEPKIPRQVYLTYAFLAYLSSTINPFIYGIMNRQFRREYKALLRKITFFRRQNGNNNSRHNVESHP
ncbi:hypothetical protein pdam_00025740 [Pocillopora damicornis]|uniref:G-protein coupled receptors family 1 profile domain-containing protein n=1 Tax=Pocillopora damicornis TaxID=46731 RepID=A0A3M6V1I9_POCDA|nr:hypothetical protein pdam_00025740 [Pocillopora damicornis]